LLKDYTLYMYMVGLSVGPLHSYNSILNEKWWDSLEFIIKTYNSFKCFYLKKKKTLLAYSVQCVTAVQVTLITDTCLKNAILTTLVAILITCDVVNKNDISTTLMNLQYKSACKISTMYLVQRIVDTYILA
jgi:hypothetical protein